MQSTIIYDLIPAEKTLDKLADQLHTLNEQYNNGLLSTEQYTHAASVIELKQEKAIKLWQKQCGLCWYTGLKIETTKRPAQNNTAQLPVINIKHVGDNQDNRISLGGWAMIWVVVIVVIGM